MSTKYNNRTSKAEKKKKKNAILMGGVLIFLMTFGILGYGFNSNSSNNGRGADQSNTFEYKGFEFTIHQVDSNRIVFGTDVNGVNMIFYNRPEDVEGIYVAPDFQKLLVSAPEVILTSKAVSLGNEVSNDNIYYDYLIKDVQALSGKKVLRASLSKDILGEYPVRDCESASADSPALILDSELDEPGQVGIFNEDNKFCFRAKGSGNDIIKLRDRIIYLANGIQK